jgi:DNA modification methylase
LKLEIDIPNIDLEKFELGYFKETDEEKLNDVPDIPENAISQTGDLFLIDGKHRVMCGDSLNIQDTEKLLNGNKIDLLFTDPPYGVSYGDKNKYLNAICRGNRIQTPIENDHKTEQETNDFWYNYFLIVKQFLNNIHSYYIFSPQIQGMMMMMMMMMKAEMPYRHVLIWNKNNHVLGRTDYNYKHEPMLYGWTKEGTHRFSGKGENTKSVWDYNKPHKSDLHPTMKPVKLIVNAILNSSLKNQIVCDSFLGSGSTLIASEQTNRICYGMEIDPIYIDVILKRYKKLYPESKFECLNREFNFNELWQN